MTNNSSSHINNSYLDNLWEKLKNLPNDQEQAEDLLEELSWEFHNFPRDEPPFYSSEKFQFLIKILSDEDLCSKENISLFLLNLRLEKQSLKKDQSTDLISIIVQNYNKFVDGGLASQAIEFIRANCNPQETIGLFQKIEKDNRNNNLTRMRFILQDYLETEDPQSETWEQARLLYNKSLEREKTTNHLTKETSNLGRSGLTVEKCWKKLHNLPDKEIGRYIENLSFELSVGQLLGLKAYSDEIFDFFLKIYQSPDLCSQRGMGSFILELTSDSDRLSNDQKKNLKCCFFENYNIYTGKDLRLCIDDFIARSLAPQDAIDAFEHLEKNFDNQTIEQILVGIESFLMNTEKSSLEWERGKQLYLRVHDRFEQADNKET